MKGKNAAYNATLQSYFMITDIPETDRHTDRHTSRRYSRTCNIQSVCFVQQTDRQAHRHVVINFI